MLQNKLFLQPIKINKNTFEKVINDLKANKKNYLNTVI